MGRSARSDANGHPSSSMALPRTTGPQARCSPVHACGCQVRHAWGRSRSNARRGLPLHLPSTRPGETSRGLLVRAGQAPAETPRAACQSTSTVSLTDNVTWLFAHSTSFPSAKFGRGFHRLSVEGCRRLLCREGSDQERRQLRGARRRTPARLLPLRSKPSTLLVLAEDAIIGLREALVWGVRQRRSRWRPWASSLAGEHSRQRQGQAHGNFPARLHAAWASWSSRMPLCATALREGCRRELVGRSAPLVPFRPRAVALQDSSTPIPASLVSRLHQPSSSPARSGRPSLRARLAHLTSRSTPT